MSLDCKCVGEGSELGFCGVGANISLPIPCWFGAPAAVIRNSKGILKRIDRRCVGSSYSSSLAIPHWLLVSAHGAAVRPKIGQFATSLW